MVPQALAASIQINPQIPYVSSSNVPGLVQGFYLFALSIAGILAFGAMVYGGVKYATGRGNPSAESEGRSWITSALLGLLLLGGAYVILQTINPALTTLTMPGLPALSAPTTSTFSASSLLPTTYGCLAPNGVYACTTPTDTTCSASGLGCNGSPCIQFPQWYCGKTIAYVNMGVTNMTYGCLAPGGNFSCGPGIQDTNCAGITGCMPGSCFELPTAYCTGNTQQSISAGTPAGGTCNTSNPNTCQSGLKCCSYSISYFLGSGIYIPGSGKCQSSC